jgi:hypothetical protein
MSIFCFFLPNGWPHQTTPNPDVKAAAADAGSGGQAKRLNGECTLWYGPAKSGAFFMFISIIRHPHQMDHALYRWRGAEAVVKSIWGLFLFNTARMYCPTQNE